MVDRLTQHPYSDARNTIVLGLALWTLAVTLAALSGALARIGPEILAAALVFVSGIAVAATTLDARIAAWIASTPLARLAAGRVASSALCLLAGASLAAAVALGARILGHGAAVPLGASLLAAVPAFSGLAAALAVRWLTAPRAPVRAKAPVVLATSRAPR